MYTGFKFPSLSRSLLPFFVASVCQVFCGTLAPSFHSIHPNTIPSCPFTLSRENSPHTSSSSPRGHSGMPLHTCDMFTQVRLSHGKLPGQGGIQAEPSRQTDYKDLKDSLMVATNFSFPHICISQNPPQLSILSSEASLQCGVPSQSCW